MSSDQAEPRPGEGARATGTAGVGRGRLRALLLGAIAVLYAVSIPWYRASDAEPAIWLGLPDWVAVALVCYVAVAALNCAAWLLTEVRDPGEDGP